MWLIQWTRVALAQMTGTRRLDHVRAAAVDRVAPGLRDGRPPMRGAVSRNHRDGTAAVRFAVSGRIGCAVTTPRCATGPRGTLIHRVTRINHVNPDVESGKKDKSPKARDLPIQ
jgi:hypothetical protein